MQDSEQLSEKFAKLRAPFDVELVLWRAGARTKDKKRGQALPYINARLIQDRLDEVMGPENWRNEFAAAPMGGGLMCVLSLRIGEEWVSKADVAQQDEVSENSRDPDQAREIAIKGAASDAFKRAAVQWGVGRYLYSFEAPWVELENERYIKRDETPKLRKLLRDHARGESTRERPEHEREERRAGLERGAQSTERHASTGHARRSASPAESAASASDAKGEQPSSADTGGSSSQGAAVDARRNRPSFGTDEQWKSITPRQRMVVKSIFDRVRHGAPLDTVETFLTDGEGKSFPEWLNTGLLDGVRKKIKQSKEQAGQSVH